MWITIEDVMQLDALQGGYVIAGDQGLDRSLNSVTVLDAPDAVSWLKGHELVLTSTFPLMRRRRELDRVVEEMVARRVAGLGVKLNRFMTELPPAMLHKADELGFPIVSLPVEIAWIDVINPIFARVLSRTAAVQRSEPIRNSFNELLLSGADLQAFVDALSRLVQKPVIIHSPVSRLRLASSGLDERNMASELALIAQTPSRQSRRVSSDHDVFELPRSPGRLVYATLDPGVDAAAQVIIVDDAGNLAESDLWCLVHARDAMSIKLRQNRAEISIEREKKNEFVHALFDAGLSEAAHAKLLRRGQDRGYRLYERYVVAALRFPRLADTALSHLSDFLHQKLTDEDVLVGWNGNARFLLLIPERPHAGFSVDGGASYVQTLLREIGHQGGQAHWYAGLSQILPNNRLARGLEQAEYALQRSMASERSCELKLHDDTSLHRMFSHAAIQQDVHSYVQEWLEPLIQHDQRHQSRLADTLRVFLECNGNHREAARLLHIHHNTVRYRISQIEQLTRRNILQPKLRFQYQLALYLMTTLEREYA